MISDEFFVKGKLLKIYIERSIPLISRLQFNAALYAKPTHVAKRRGRPLRFGERLPSLTQLAKV